MKIQNGNPILTLTSLFGPKETGYVLYRYQGTLGEIVVAARYSGCVVIEDRQEVSLTQYVAWDKFGSWKGGQAGGDFNGYVNVPTHVTRITQDQYECLYRLH